MYHALLTNRYLTSRVIPLIAVAAVALCVALVIIVVSVMTGFLDMVRSSGRTLMGDVIISFPVSGIPYYDRLIEKLESLDAVAAATPVVDSWGLLRMPYPDGPSKETETVQVWGIDPASFARVTAWAGGQDGDDEKSVLYWRTYQPRELTAMADDDLRKIINEPPADGGPTTAAMLQEDGLSLIDSRTGRPGIVPGIHVSIANVRQSDGSIHPMDAMDADGGWRRYFWWMVDRDVTLTLLPIDQEGGLLDPEPKIFPIVNEFASGVFMIDDTRVMIPIDVAQEMLALGESRILGDDVDPDTGRRVAIGVDPPKATMVLVRAADGLTPDDLQPLVDVAYTDFYRDLLHDEDALVKPPPPPIERRGLTIKTWEQQQSQFIGPIEKERELMRTLFSLVYLVCAGLVLAIFWAIVYEKTRDIGILRSIGASRFGISWIFLRYGLVIGVAGSICGVGLGFLVVHNINYIHQALVRPPLIWPVTSGVLTTVAVALTFVTGRKGELLPIVLGSIVSATLLVLTIGMTYLHVHGGVLIWDPAVYYFTVIPNELDWQTAAITMVGAVLFSLVGAFLPAAKAADTDPVKALRYE